MKTASDILGWGGEDLLRGLLHRQPIADVQPHHPHHAQQAVLDRVRFTPVGFVPCVLSHMGGGTARDSKPKRP